MSKTLIRLDKIQAFEVGNISNIIVDSALENGRVVALGDEISDSRIYEGLVPDAVAIIAKEILLHASAEAIYSPTNAIDDFELAINKVGRAFHLTIGDEFTVTQDAIDGVIAEGKYVIPQANSTKLIIANDLTGGTTLALKVVDKDVKLGTNRDAVTLRVVKNAIGAVKSAFAEILTYSFTEETGDAVIDSENGTIDIEVANGTVVTALVATFTTSSSITSITVGNAAQVSATTDNDFTNPVVYTVIAENGITTKDWTVTVTVAEA